MTEKKVYIFTKSNCPFSEMTKMWFRNRNINFEEKIVSDKNFFNNEYNFSYKDLPQIVVGRERVGNYRELVKKEEYVFYLLGILDLN